MTLNTERVSPNSKKYRKSAIRIVIALTVTRTMKACLP